MTPTLHENIDFCIKQPNSVAIFITKGIFLSRLKGLGLISETGDRCEGDSIVMFVSYVVRKT